MQLVTTVLRQRGVMARYFSKKWSLIFHQPERICRSLFLRTEFSGGNLPHARYQLPFVLAGTRFFSKRSPSIPKKRFSKRFFRKWRPSPGKLLSSVPEVVVPEVWPHVPVI